MLADKSWYRKKRFLIPCIIAGLILILAIIWPFVGPGLVEQRLNSRLNISQDEKLEFTNLSVGIFPLRLSADSLMLKKQVAAQKHTWWLNAQVKDIELSLPLWQFISGSKKISVDEIAWSTARFRMNEGKRLTSPDSSASTSGQGQIYHVENVNLGSTSVRAQRDTQKLEANLELNLKGLEFGGGQNPFPQWRSIHLKMRDFMVFAITPDYNLSFKQLSADSKNEALEIQALNYAVRYGKQEMQQKHRYMQVQSRLSIKELLFNGFEINRLGEGLFVKNIICSGADYHIYQDSRKPLKKDTIPLPSKVLADIDYPFAVDTLWLENSKMLFEGKAKDEAEMAVLRGSNWQGKAWNLTNQGYETSVPLSIESQIDFYDQARLQLTANFEANSAAQQFSVNGSFQNTRLEPFNEVLKPILGFSFEEGYVNEIRFEMRGNNRGIDARVWANYQNLKIGFGSRKDGILKDIGEWAGNKLAINQNEKGTWHKVQYQRNPYRSTINYWWKTLQKALVDIMLSLGLSEADEDLDFGLGAE